MKDQLMAIIVQLPLIGLLAGFPASSAVKTDDIPAPLRVSTDLVLSVFGHVRFIQRLGTAGGNAPSEGCNQASAGGEVRVPYSAEYWFYADA